jgi:hypothetical protein
MKVDGVRSRTLPTARAQLDIDAPIERVWDVLVSLERYPEWNPFVVKVDGAARAGLQQHLTLHVVFSGGLRVRSGEFVTRVDPPGDVATLAWRFTGLLPTLGLVRAERVQTLSRGPGGRTRYESVEAFDGLLRHFVPVGRVVDGFERMAQALKARAETP